MAGAEENPVLKNCKACIRSVLMSCKDGVAASRFLRDYQEVTGENIPFKQLGFPSVAEFIKSIPDVVYAKPVGGEMTYFAVADAATRHIQSLIQRQKTSSKKSKSFKKGAARKPKFHSTPFKRTAPTRGGGGGGYKAVPPSHTPPQKVSGFSRQRHFGVKTPILPTTLHSSDFSPLTVTVRSRVGGGEEERTIARKNGAGGRQMAITALKAVVKDRPPVGNRRNYEMPPRFQKIQGGGGNSTSASERPVADNVFSEGPAVSEDALPRNTKVWAEKLIEKYPTGLWSTRFIVLFKEEFKQEPPSNLMDIVQHWTDIIKTDFNSVANRYVMYPASKSTSPTATNTPKPTQPAVVTSSQPPILQKWQNFIVPIAELFEVGEMTEVYASQSFHLSQFYLQRADSNAEDITEELNEIHESLLVPKANDLQPGVFCAALYSEDDNWYRARVLFQHSQQEVEVMFVDYGNREKVSIGNVRCLTESTAETPAQAVCCVMFALKPFDSDKGWSEEAKIQFGALMAEKKLQAHTVKIEEGNCVVELWSEDNPLSLNEQLYNAGLVDTSLPKNFDPADLELPQDGYVEVVVAFVDLAHCWLRLIGPDYSEKLESFEDNLASLYEEASKQPKRIQEGSVCIAEDELLFHRVMVKQIRGEEANCFVVDHGYTEWFPLDKLAPLDKDINMSLPYQALLCTLSGLEDYMSNTTTIEELVERSRNKICYAEIIARDPLKIMLFDTNGKDDVNINEEIAKKLASQGHDLDLTQFTAISDNTSESSRSSSPRPPSNPPSLPDVDALQSATRNLTVSENSPPSVKHSANIPQNFSGARPKYEQSIVTQGEGARPKVDQGVKSISDPDQNSKNFGAANLHSTQSDASKSHTDTSQIDVRKTVANATQSDTAKSESKPVTASNGAKSSSLAASLGVNSPSGGAPIHNDSLCVSYHTWPLPSYVPQPEVGQFFDVFVLSASDPSNFVIVPHNVLGKLEKTMEQLNAQFIPELAMELYGNTTDVKEATKVPAPQVNHLYMARVEGTFYRAVYIAQKETMYHIFMPDYCEHALISPDDLFFLPRKFWSMPFAAFKAALHGIKPSGVAAKHGGGLSWSEATKYTFIQLTLNKTLVALLKDVSGGSEVGDGGDVTQMSKQKLSLQLISTADPVEDVIIADALLATSFGTVVSV